MIIDDLRITRANWWVQFWAFCRPCRLRISATARSILSLLDIHTYIYIYTYNVSMYGYMICIYIYIIYHNIIYSTKRETTLFCWNYLDVHCIYFAKLRSSSSCSNSWGQNLNMILVAMNTFLQWSKMIPKLTLHAEKWRTLSGWCTAVLFLFGLLRSQSPSDPR